MRFSRNSLRLYVVTDRSWLNGRKLEDQVECIIQNGATLIQLREKSMSTEEFIAEAKKIKEVTDRYAIPFLINDNVDVALAVDANGVHLGQKDMTIKQARAFLGDSKIIGVSVQTVEQAIEAMQQSADYLGVGAIFPTMTKTDTKDVGIERLAEIAAAVNIPVVAIGGISDRNIIKLKDTGISGIAVVSAIFAAKDISLAARRLKGLTDVLL